MEELDEILSLIGFNNDYLPPATPYQKLCFFQDWLKDQPSIEDWQDLEDLQHDHNQEIRKLKEEISDLEEKIDIKDDKLAELDQDVRDLDAMIRDLKNTIDTLERDIKILEN